MLNKLVLKRMLLLLVCILMSSILVSAENIEFAQEDIVREVFGDTVYQLARENYPSLFFSGSYLDHFVKKKVVVIDVPVKVIGFSTPIVPVKMLKTFEKVEKDILEIEETIEVEETENIMDTLETLETMPLNLRPVIIKLDGFKFDPPEIEVQVGQEVVWMNERDNLKAMVVGMREISSMRSKFLQPGDKFSWTFIEPGNYQYVDAVVIGSLGKIIVK